MKTRSRVLAMLPFLFGVLLLTSDAGAQKLSVDVNFTMLRAHVVDDVGRAVLDLKSDDFELLENGVPIPLHHFSLTAGPAEIGVLLDASLSTRAAKDDLKQTIGQLVSAMNYDHVFLMTFARDTDLVVPPTYDRAAITKALGGIKYTAGSRFYDAVLQALDELVVGRLERKALIILTDGADHFSVHSFEQLLNTARFYGCEIYIIGYPGDDSRTYNQAGRNVIRSEFFQLARTTGGQVVFPAGTSESSRAAQQFVDSLHHEYRFGFYSSRPFNVPSEVRIRIRGRRGERLYVHTSLVEAPLP